MITGIGVDLIEIDRIRASVERHGDRFLTKLFTPAEIAYCSSKQNMHQHLAGRFAAKEAFSKALATGWTGSFRWKDVEIINEESGRPTMSLHGSLRAGLSPSVIHVSISHSLSHVVACVVIEGPVP
jgi:holo-[acyl-carrier protein] synthase